MPPIGAAPPPIVVWPSPFITAVSLLVEEVEHGGLLRADARLASPFCRQRRVYGTARHHLAVSVAHPRGCGWLRHCEPWQQAAALIVALSLHIFCCCRAHFPLIEEYLVLLLSLRIIICRSSRHVQLHRNYA